MLGFGHVMTGLELAVRAVTVAADATEREPLLVVLSVGITVMHTGPRSAALL